MTHVSDSQLDVQTVCNLLQSVLLLKHNYQYTLCKILYLRLSLFASAVQKVSDVIFFPWKLMKYRRCAVVGRWRVPSCAYMDFFLPADSVSRMQPACEWQYIHAARGALLFSAKMTEWLEQQYCIKFCQFLVTAKWKPFGRFSRFSATMPWASHKLRSGTTDLKMAACQWRATHVPVGLQQAEMTSSLTKCGLWSCRTIVSPSENLRWRWG